MGRVKASRRNRKEGWCILHATKGYWTGIYAGRPKWSPNIRKAARYPDLPALEEAWGVPVDDVMDLTSWLK